MPKLPRFSGLSINDRISITKNWRGGVGWKLYLAMKIQSELESKDLNGFEMNLNKSSK